MQDMPIVTIPVALGILAAAQRKRRSVILYGPSGIGKSDLVHQFAASLGAIVVDVRASQWESIDFRGIPDIEAGLTQWNLPAVLPFKGNPKFDEDGPPIVIFFDEFNSGDPSVSAVLYQITQDHRCGEHILMDNVFVVLAGNREEDRGVVNRTPAPLGNRCTQVELVPDVRTWSIWGQGAGVSPVVIGFLNFKSDLLHNFNPAAPAKVFCSPRAWKNSSDDFIDHTLGEDVRMAMIGGNVGTGPCSELFAFRDIMSTLVSIDEIIANPKGVQFDSRLDLQWALAMHVSGSMTKANVAPLHTFLARLEPEMVVMSWTMAIARDEDITESDTFLNDYAPHYRDLFQG